MKNAFKIHREGDLLIVENSAYPPVKIEFDCNKKMVEIKKVHVTGKCKISEVKKTLKQIALYMEKNQTSMFQGKRFRRNVCFSPMFY